MLAEPRGAAGAVERGEQRRRRRATSAFVVPSARGDERQPAAPASRRGARAGRAGRRRAGRRSRRARASSASAERGRDGGALAAARVGDELGAELRASSFARGVVGHERGRPQRGARGEHVAEHRERERGASLIAYRGEPALRPRAPERDDDPGHGKRVSGRGKRRLDNQAIASRLEAFAALLELAGANPYSARAYRRAAELIRSTPAPVARARARGPRARAARDRPGIEARLRELVETGEIAELAELEANVSPELVGVGRMLGISPQRALELGRALGVRTLGGAARGGGGRAAARGAGDRACERGEAAHGARAGAAAAGAAAAAALSRAGAGRGDRRRRRAVRSPERCDGTATRSRSSRSSPPPRTRRPCSHGSRRCRRSSRSSSATSGARSG